MIGYFDQFCNHYANFVKKFNTPQHSKNTKITSMHLYPRRWNVAAQEAKELKTVTYATPPMKECRKKRETEVR